MHEPRGLSQFVPPEGFTVARALESGESARRMRATDLARPFWGVRASLSPAALVDRCRLLALRMPETAFFSHATAARLHGMPVPWRDQRDEALHVSVTSPARAPHARQIRGHRSSATEKDVVVVNGVRVTRPARTWVDLAEGIPLADLVAAGDFLIHHRSPLTTKGELTSEFHRRTSRRGLRTIRDALPLLDDQAESAPESILRVMLVQGGFELPTVNHSVVDRFGEFVARTDLVLPTANLVLEYMGDYHRTTKGQWRADMTRRARLEATGRKVMEVNADDLRDPVELMVRIRRRILVG